MISAPSGHGAKPFAPIGVFGGYELPANLDDDAVRDEKIKVLRALRLLTEDC